MFWRSIVLLIISVITSIKIVSIPDTSILKKTIKEAVIKEDYLKAYRYKEKLIKAEKEIEVINSTPNYFEIVQLEGISNSSEKIKWDIYTKETEILLEIPPPDVLAWSRNSDEELEELRES